MNIYLILQCLKDLSTIPIKWSRLFHKFRHYAPNKFTKKDFNHSTMGHHHNTSKSNVYMG